MVKYGELGNLKRDRTLISWNYPLLLVMKSPEDNERFLFLSEGDSPSTFLVIKISLGDLISFLKGEYPMYDFFKNSKDIFILEWSAETLSWRSSSLGESMSLREDWLPVRGEVFEIGEEDLREYLDSLEREIEK